MAESYSQGTVHLHENFLWLMIAGAKVTDRSKRHVTSTLGTPGNWLLLSLDNPDFGAKNEGPNAQVREWLEGGDLVTAIRIPEVRGVDLADLYVTVASICSEGRDKPMEESTVYVIQCSPKHLSSCVLLAMRGFNPFLSAGAALA